MDELRERLARHVLARMDPAILALDLEGYELGQRQGEMMLVQELVGAFAASLREEGIRLTPGEQRFLMGEVVADVMSRRTRREIVGSVTVEPTVERLERLGTWNSELVAYLQACIEAGRSVLISGEKGAGKTTLLSTLMSFAPDARLVSIEQTPQLRADHEHLVRLQGTGTDLFEWALQLAADWLVVDELLPETALDLLQTLAAVPVMGAIKGTSARNALGRMVQWVIDAAPGMAEALVRRLVADHVDVIVNVARLYEGTHRITEILEVLWDDEMGGGIHAETVVALDETDSLAATGVESAFVSDDALREMPYVDVSQEGDIAGPMLNYSEEGGA